MKPRLVFSTLSGTCYVLTRYSIKGNSIVAGAKHEIPAGDLERVIRERSSWLRRQSRKAKKAGTSLLAWWFIVFNTSFYGGAATQGPFDTKEECEKMREWVASQVLPRWSNNSWCWYATGRR